MKDNFFFSTHLSPKYGRSHIEMSSVYISDTLDLCSFCCIVGNRYKIRRSSAHHRRLYWHVSTPEPSHQAISIHAKLPRRLFYKRRTGQNFSCWSIWVWTNIFFYHFHPVICIFFSKINYYFKLRPQSLKFSSNTCRSSSDSDQEFDRFCLRFGMFQHSALVSAKCIVW